VIVIDLKADSLELLATRSPLQKGLSENAASSSRSSAFRIRPIVQRFAFNPMTQSFWENFDLLTRPTFCAEPMD
jgi:hypothetical protein